MDLQALTGAVSGAVCNAVVAALNSTSGTQAAQAHANPNQPAVQAQTT